MKASPVALLNFVIFCPPVFKQMSFNKRLSSFLPGIFLFGFTVGTGSVTAMAKAGADYGMALLWTIFISCLITFLLIHQFGKFTLITGETALYAFRKHIHPLAGLFFIVALTAHVSGSVIGVMGIIADISYQWSLSLVEGGIAPVYFALFFVAIVYLLFLDGRTRFFETVLAVVVAVMSICFLINFLVLMPPLEEIVSGLIPKVPKTKPGESSFLVMASMVGTTVFSGLFILRTTLVKEANWTFEDLKIQRRDAAFSGFMMFMVSAAIMAAAAGSLHKQGVVLNNVSEMISLLEPIAGPMAVGIFTIGIIAAGISSQFPNITLLPWMLDDYHQRKTDMRRPLYRVIVLIISLLGLLVPVFKAKPIAVMIVSQAFGALVLPVTVLCFIYIGNKKSLMGAQTLGRALNFVLTMIFIFALIMSYMSYLGLFEVLRSL
jgi:Mn2+/Fe2+ NRAMP family transporter